MNQGYHPNLYAGVPLPVEKIGEESDERKYVHGPGNYRFFMRPDGPVYRGIGLITAPFPYPSLIPEPSRSSAISCSPCTCISEQWSRPRDSCLTGGRNALRYGGSSPGHGKHGTEQSQRTAGSADPGQGSDFMIEKLCPFDKEPCIRERCAVFREESGTCAFLLAGPGMNIPRHPPEKSSGARSSSGYRAHLFD